MILTELEAEAFKNMTNCRVPFKRLNLLLGPTGAGKTAVLQAIAFAHLGYDPLTPAAKRTTADLFATLSTGGRLASAVTWNGGAGPEPLAVRRAIEAVTEQPAETAPVRTRHVTAITINGTPAKTSDAEAVIRRAVGLSPAPYTLAPFLASPADKQLAVLLQAAAGGDGQAEPKRVLLELARQRWPDRPELHRLLASVPESDSPLQFFTDATAAVKAAAAEARSAATRSAAAANELAASFDAAGQAALDPAALARAKAAAESAVADRSAAVQRLHAAADAAADAQRRLAAIEAEVAGMKAELDDAPAGTDQDVDRLLARQAELHGELKRHQAELDQARRQWQQRKADLEQKLERLRGQVQPLVEATDTLRTHQRQLAEAAGDTPAPDDDLEALAARRTELQTAAAETRTMWRAAAAVASRYYLMAMEAADAAAAALEAATAAATGAGIDGAGAGPWPAVAAHVRRCHETISRLLAALRDDQERGQGGDLARQADEARRRLAELDRQIAAKSACLAGQSLAEKERQLGTIAADIQETETALAAANADMDAHPAASRVREIERELAATAERIAAARSAEQRRQAYAAAVKARDTLAASLPAAPTDQELAEAEQALEQAKAELARTEQQAAAADRTRTLEKALADARTRLQAAERRLGDTDAALQLIAEARHQTLQEPLERLTANANRLLAACLPGASFWWECAAAAKAGRPALAFGLRHGPNGRRRHHAALSTGELLAVSAAVQATIAMALPWHLLCLDQVTDHLDAEPAMRLLGALAGTFGQVQIVATGHEHQFGQYADTMASQGWNVRRLG